MNWVEYEKLAVNRDHLNPAQERRLEELDAEDERIGNKVAAFWFPEIVGGYLIVLVIAGFLF